MLSLQKLQALQSSTPREPRLVVDLFAGGGGASMGIEAALKRPVDVALNHSATAIAVHAMNHPRTIHLRADIWEVKPRVATGGRRVALLWASPDCRHFSKAKAGKPVAQKIRALAWAVIRWANDVGPDVIILENVEEFRDWGPLDEHDQPIKQRKGETFRRWKRQLERAGYVVDHRILDASHYGTPTSRRRLFLVARRDGHRIRWPAQTHGGLGLLPVRTAAECIDWSIQVPSIFGRRRPLAEKTLSRIGQGIRRFVVNSNHPFIAPLESPAAPAHEQRQLVAAFLTKHFGGVVGIPLTQPIGTITSQDHHALTTATLHPAPADGPRVAQVRAFLTTYYGSEKVGQSLWDALRTVTTKDRFGLVTVAGTAYEIVDIGMRMLDPAELLRAQFGRFASLVDLSAARTKTAMTRLIGNSVCPELAEAVVRANFEHDLQLQAA